MGTRSSIFIKATNVNGNTKYYRFYKHYDGYPTGNLPLIQKIGILYYALKKPIKNIVELASKLDNCESEFEGAKDTLEDIIKHNEHGDLEWSYLVDLDDKSIKIFSSNGDSSRVLTNKVTNPLEYVNCLRDECKANETYQTNKLIEGLEKLGFKVN